MRGSFLPPVIQRELRELTRQRLNFVRERATLVKRIQKTLESVNIKLARVATEAMGVSGRAMLEANITGTRNSAKMVGLAKGRLREKREQLDKALDGWLHQQFFLLNT